MHSSSEIVVILYTSPWKTPFREHVSPRLLARLGEAICAGGWRPRVVEYSPKTLACVVEEIAPHLVLNIAYGYVEPAGEHVDTQVDVTRRLELLGMVAVGASAEAQALAQDKLHIATRLRRLGIRSPRLLRPRDPDLPALAIRKPRLGACSRGVDLIDPRTADAWMGVCPDHGGGSLGRDVDEVLIQEYIDGPEWSVGVIERDTGPFALSPLRLQFVQDSAPTIADFRRFPWVDVVDRADPHGLGPLSVEVFRHLGLRDYARFDFRVDARGPVLLDANALPNLDPEASLLPIMARHDGISHGALIQQLIRSALRRRT